MDFVREFNLENERFMEFRSVLKGGKHKVRISRVPFKYEASAVLQRTVEFAGQTFDVNAEATADVSWDMWRFGYEYDFVAGRRRLLRLHRRSEAEQRQRPTCV